MRTFPILVILLALLLPTGASSHGDSCTPTTSEPEFDSGGITSGLIGTYYVDNDPDPQMWSIWIYEESNGIEGLQRRDEVKDDTCGGMIKGDTIIF